MSAINSDSNRSILPVKNINSDKVFIILAEVYVILPVILFLIGWTNIIYAAIGCVICAAFGIKLFKSCNTESEVKLFTKNNLWFWIISAVLTAAWVYLSGIGGLAYQNGDFWARNPIYRELSTSSWPVVIDFSNQSELVKEYCGEGKAAFVYYYCWWLPASLIAKAFGMGEMARNIVLMIWTFTGLYLVIYLLCRKMRKCLWYIPFILIFFSGLDAIPYWLSHNFLDTFPWVTHIEFWAGYFQYSCNTTQLFWVFNQSIPVWIIMALMIQLRDSRVNIALAAISFAYSPWATMGLAPYGIYASVKGEKEIKEAFNVVNYTMALFMFCIFGVFYLSGAGAESTTDFIFFIYRDHGMYLVKTYIYFVIFEFAIYFLILGRTVANERFYWFTFTELLLIPLVVVRDNNFNMRASIPALFMLMYYVICFINSNKEAKHPSLIKCRKGLIIVALCVGAMTPLAEINRSVINTATMDYFLEDPVGSFSDMQTDEAWRVDVIRQQFFAYDYENMVFFKYPDD